MTATAELRRTIYLVLTVLATAIAAAKVVGVENVWEPSRYPGPNRTWPAERPLPTPMFGSNDKSRWLTVRALVDHGTFVIGHRDVPDDPKTDRGLVFEDGWTSVDKVKNPATHDYYSSKPPLFAVMLAGEYWVLKKCFGLSIVEDRWVVVIIILLTVNVLPFAIALLLLARLIETYGTTDFGKLIAFATAAVGTFLITFSNTLNNHSPAACCVVFAIYPLLRSPGPPSKFAMILSGFFATLTATFEIPALSFTVAILSLTMLRWKALASWMLLGAMVPAVAYFAANYAAIGQLKPAYSGFGGPWYDYPGSHWQRLQIVKAGGQVPGIDFAKESTETVLFHCLLGHHGWFSLTPIWLIGIVGCIATCRKAIRSWRENPLSFEILVQLAWVLTLVLTVFFVYVWKSNNYGGNTSCLRWFLWLTPLWVLAMLTGADRLAGKKWARGLTLLLLGLSIFSVFYPAWNPWRSPWILDGLEYWEIVNYER